MANRDRVQMLVDALRSGDYEQASNQLGYVDVEGNKWFCCLGVAMEIAVANGCPTTVQDRDGDLFYIDVEGEEEQNVLTYAAKTWYGFDDDNPNLNATGIGDNPELESETASELNDSAHWDFNMIADAFEQTYLRDPA